MTKHSTEHTALPWRVGDAGHTVFGPMEDTPAPRVVAATTRANAAYIAQACNAYPALVEALEQYITEWHSKASNYDRKEPQSLTMARAALAQTQEDK